VQRKEIVTIFMPEFYCDEQKYNVRFPDPICYDRVDKKAQQRIAVRGSVYGVTIHPDKKWSPLCEALFKKEKANSIRLGGLWSPWESDLSFVNELPGCKSLTIGYQIPLDFSVLVGNSSIERLQLDYSGKVAPGEFELSSLPNLKQCRIPLHAQFMSVLKCQKLISLALSGGKYDGELNLEPLGNLEELRCDSVSKIKGVSLNPKTRLRALDLIQLKAFEIIKPMNSVAAELRVVTLDRVPRMQIEWLAHACKVECVALRVGNIPSIKFLSGLHKLQVLDLFGSKVLDGDFSVRDTLKQKLDTKSWGSRSR
jgi:hypothetical protein